MTNLLLHIGTEKTGSTSIQSFLKSNWRSLLASGVAYPRFFSTSHSGELYLCAKRDDYSD